MINKIIDFCKKIWNKYVFIFGGGILIIFGILDYLIKWQITSFIYLNILILLNLLKLFIFNTIIFIWLFVITLFLAVRTFNGPRTTELKEPLINTKEEILKESKNLELKVNRILEMKISPLNTDIANIKKRLHDIERDNLADKDSPAFYELIDLLKMDINRNYEFEISETIEKILRLLREKKVYADDVTNLNKQLNRLPNEYNEIKSQIRNEIKI